MPWKQTHHQSKIEKAKRVHCKHKILTTHTKKHPSLYACPIWNDDRKWLETKIGYPTRFSFLRVEIEESCLNFLNEWVKGRVSAEKVNLQRWNGNESKKQRKKMSNQNRHTKTEPRFIVHRRCCVVVHASHRLATLKCRTHTKLLNNNTKFERRTTKKAKQPNGSTKFAITNVFRETIA